MDFSKCVGQLMDFQRPQLSWRTASHSGWAEPHSAESRCNFGLPFKFSRRMGGFGTFHIAEFYFLGAQNMRNECEVMWNLWRTCGEPYHLASSSQDARWLHRRLGKHRIIQMDVQNVHTEMKHLFHQTMFTIFSSQFSLELFSSYKRSHAAGWTGRFFWWQKMVVPPGTWGMAKSVAGGRATIGTCRCYWHAGL